MGSSVVHAVPEVGVVPLVRGVPVLPDEILGPVLDACEQRGIYQLGCVHPRGAKVVVVPVRVRDRSVGRALQRTRIDCVSDSEIIG